MAYADDDWDDEDDDEPDYAADKAAAQEWARKLLAKPERWVILDSETTGLEYDAEPLQIAVLSPTGEILLDTMVLPSTGRVPSDVVPIHGITMERLQAEGAQPFATVYERLQAAVGERVIVCYNADYDSRVLRYACGLIGVPSLPNRWECAMEQYAAYAGHWSTWHGSYTWQRLPRGTQEETHSALSDCRAVLRLLQRMAR